MNDIILPEKVFNLEKTDYGTNRSMFLGQAPGLFDTIHRTFPEVWKFYKTMRSLDWDEQEFDFRSCNVEFKTKPKSITERMRKTLAWQWEADSIAARMIMPVMGPFISSPELTAAWSRIQENEIVHAATYSEIVRWSFDNPETILQEILQVKEAHERMSVIGKVLQDAYVRSHQFALGLVPDDQDTYNQAFLFTAAIYIMERIQFMASFAVTFAIGESGAFMPIAKAVQKICQDEYEVHQALGRHILKHEMSTDRGKVAMQQCWPIIQRMIDEVNQVEHDWNRDLMQGEPLVGLTESYLNSWVLFSVADVYRTFEKRPEYSVPKTNPLKYMENWMDISKTQSAPKEQQKGDYKVNVVKRSDADKEFAVDF